MKIISTHDLNMYIKRNSGLSNVLADFKCSEEELLKQLTSCFGGNEARGREALETLRGIDEANEKESKKRAKTRQKNAVKQQKKAEEQKKAEQERLDAMTPLEKKEYYRSQFSAQLDSINGELVPISAKLGEQSKFIAQLRKKKVAAQKALDEVNKNLTNAIEAHDALKARSAELVTQSEEIGKKISEIDKEILSLSQPVFLVFNIGEINAENFDMSTVTDDKVDSEAILVKGLCESDRTGRFDLRKREIRPVAALLAAVRATGRKDCVVNFDNGLDEMKNVFEELRR